MLNNSNCILRVTPAFINGHGERITDTHQDDYDNILLIISGSKTFYLAAPNSPYVKHRDVGEDWEAHDSTPYTHKFDYVTTLIAGDVLFIPRGWWHHVITHERSVMMNFWFDPRE